MSSLVCLVVLFFVVSCSSMLIPGNLSSVPSSSTPRHLVGNLSEAFAFDVASPSTKVTYLGLNGYSLFIMGVGFSNRSKFQYDEKNNRLTILSLDASTVGFYSAVDANWQTFTTVISAINVSSFEIHNTRVSEENINGSSLVSCSVSIIRSTFQSNDPSSSTGIENLPRLDLFLSTRTLTSEQKLTNETLNGQNFTRTMTLKRPMTRADHNGTLQCQVESNNNLDVYLIRQQFVDFQYGPNLEAGAMDKVQLESEIMKKTDMECQIEGNPSPSYVWYEISSNISTGSASVYQPAPVGKSVFGTSRQIERFYQYPGQYAMQCQAQANGKTIRQDFVVSVLPPSNAMKNNANLPDSGEKSSRIPMIIGLVIGGVFLFLLAAIVGAVLVYLRRAKPDPNGKDALATNDKPAKSRWGTSPIDYSSSTSHLVESAETPSSSAIQPPSIPARPSPLPTTSTQSSYRQAPSSIVSLSYRQASSLPGFRPLVINQENDDDEVCTNIIVNRSRLTTPLGSRKSLSESIQSLRSNQQPALSLPMKKRSHNPPREMKKDYADHHYQNPEDLRPKTASTSSEEDESESQAKVKQPDEAPPSYQQVAHRSSPLNGYVYHEPTEV